MAKDSRKKVVVLGSTGSIGTQTLDIIKRNPERFRVTCLTCGNNVDRLIDQISSMEKEERPGLCVCGTEKGAARVRSLFPDIKTASGDEGLITAAEWDGDIVLNALMGMRGMVPTYHAIKAGRDIALANKETLVAGGSVIMKAARDYAVKILPVDSEHSAIFQCLLGNRGKKIKRILLTCSGGPFRGMTKDELRAVTPEMALKHPNWSMGKKITIDSATLMNKGLEMIEAKWLFGVDMDRIEVLIHPESIVHSGVEFMDTSVLCQMGTPDMRIPISVALGFPDRLTNDFTELDFFGKASKLTFEEPDRETFGLLDVAAEASRKGGTYPACMNAANEVLVQAFLEGKIGFTDIEDGIKKMLDEHESKDDPGLEDIVEKDRETREKTFSLIDKIQGEQG